LHGVWYQLLLSGSPVHLSGNDIRGAVHFSIGMLINKSTIDIHY
jgi:hypothetical protein